MPRLIHRFKYGDKLNVGSVSFTYLGNHTFVVDSPSILNVSAIKKGDHMAVSPKDKAIPPPKRN